MRSNKITFYILLLCLMATTIILTLLLRQIVPQYITPMWPAQIVFFSIICVVVYLLTMKMRSKDNLSKFTNFYMATTIIKLVIYLAVVLTYALLVPEDGKGFVVSFLVYYLCFTFFETYFLTKKNKNQDE